MSFALPCALLLAGVARAQQVDVVDLSGGKRLAILQPAGTPRGSVILIPGGSTLLDIPSDGTTFASNNFVVRTRDRFVSAGFVTALVSNPAHLGDAIARLRSIARPVFLVSTSRGTTVAVQNAIDLGDAGPDGIALTSSITVGNGSVLDLPLERIHVPVFVLANSGDTCDVSPPSGAAQIAARIVPASLVTTTTLASSELKSRPCDARSPHGYLGIEDQATGAIIEWMKKHR